MSSLVPPGVQRIEIPTATSLPWIDHSTNALEMLLQLVEALNFDQLASASIPHFFPLQRPRVRMRDEYGIQSRRERRIDIGLGRVPDHPRLRWFEFALPHHRRIGSLILLW